MERQTTVLVGGSNGTATLTSILGDKSNPLNDGHVIRVVTRSKNRFIDGSGSPRVWKCHEQQMLSNLVPVSFQPKKWKTYMGRPDSVFSYDEMSAALSGIGADDDGGVADIVLMCCPVTAHLEILRHIARALYEMNEKSLLLSNSEKPLLFGTMYAGGGFDWMCRIAFCVEKKSNFTSWKRPLGLFGLRSFPYLCKSTEPGVVKLFGRYPKLNCAVCPPSPSTRFYLDNLLSRVLQCSQTNIHLNFMGISSAQSMGGDGSAAVVDAALNNLINVTSSSDLKQGNKSYFFRGNSPKIDLSQPNVSMADLADPHSSLAFLGCTLNASNQLLHPTICSSLFKDGSITWPVNNPQYTKFPRFYADGVTKEVGRLIVTISTIEIYPILYTLDILLAPNGMLPISSHHGGEPVGQFTLNETGNSPADLARRSGLTEYVLLKQQNSKLPSIPTRRPSLNFYSMFSFLMFFGLKYNGRLGKVLSPAYRDPNDPTKIKPIVTTRFFTDDVPHGLCIILGIAEILGFDLEHHLKETLQLVRKLQSWMGKQYVLPSSSSSSRIVADAPDVKETSAPQAFGIYSLNDFKLFLSMSPFGENNQSFVEDKVRNSFISRNNTEQFIQSKL